MIIIKSVMLSFQFGSAIRLIGGYQGLIKSAGTVDSADMSIIYGTTQKN